jgi:hypothetical protein
VSIYFEFSAMEIDRIYGFPGTRLSGTSGLLIILLTEVYLRRVLLPNVFPDFVT